MSEVLVINKYSDLLFHPLMDVDFWAIFYNSNKKEIQRKIKQLTINLLYKYPKGIHLYDEIWDSLNITKEKDLFETIYEDYKTLKKEFNKYKDISYFSINFTHKFSKENHYTLIKSIDDKDNLIIYLVISENEVQVENYIKSTISGDYTKKLLYKLKPGTF